MWRIVEFISRFGNFFLFLGLEVVSLFLIINLNAYHRAVFGGFALEATGKIHEINSNFSSYFSLTEENQKLMLQNEVQAQRIDKMRKEIDLYKNQVPLTNDYLAVPDSVLPDYEFDFIPCRAINNTLDDNYNYITLNKGYRDGVRTGMGLIAPEGVVGVVMGTSTHYSRALSLLNKNTRISARQLNRRNVGTVTWSGGKPEFASFEFIPQTATITIGDTVVTSGYSTVFPEKFVIGFVEEFDKNNHDGFYNIKLRLASNFLGLDNLFILKHRGFPEIDSLENQSKIP